MHQAIADITVGLTVWLSERRHNEDFGGGVARGLSSGVWWTTVAMTQRGAGNFGPRTMPGRAVAMLWMVGSIIAIAVFTAGITAALTVRQLQGTVREVADLSTVRVGAVNGTTAEDLLRQLRVWPVTFATPKDALLALRAGNIDAVVYDRPLLAWFVKQDFQSSIQLLDTIFDFQNYAFAVPLNSRTGNRSASPCQTRRKAHGGARQFFAIPARGDTEAVRIVADLHDTMTSSRDASTWDVAFWHEAEIPACTLCGRYRVKADIEKPHSANSIYEYTALSSPAPNIAEK